VGQEQLKETNRGTHLKHEMFFAADKVQKKADNINDRRNVNRDRALNQMEKLKDQLQLHQFLQVPILPTLLFNVARNTQNNFSLVFRTAKSWVNGSKKRTSQLKMRHTVVPRPSTANGLGTRLSRLKSRLTRTGLFEYNR